LKVKRPTRLVWQNNSETILACSSRWQGIISVFYLGLVAGSSSV
jgi:hypothetical protein